MRSRIEKAFRALGRIDEAHESKKITKQQHDIGSKRVLRKLLRKK